MEAQRLLAAAYAAVPYGSALGQSVAISGHLCVQLVGFALGLVVALDEAGRCQRCWRGRWCGRAGDGEARSDSCSKLSVFSLLLRICRRRHRLPRRRLKVLRTRAHAHAHGACSARDAAIVAVLGPGALLIATECA